MLDQRKDEAIERTFKQVSREFANVFEKLVPAGKGRLIIQRKSDRQVREEEESGEEGRRESAVENYTGVGISVSFNSRHDEQQRIQQLSGGQKSEYHHRHCICHHVTEALRVTSLADTLSRSLRPRPRLRDSTV